jgi:hypothetical protein
MTGLITARLSESQVRERLQKCRSELVDDAYSFGQTLSREAVDNVRMTESKATYMAAYGAAIVSLLVSSSSAWTRIGNQWTPWYGFLAGLSGLLCTVMAIRALSPSEYECVSEDEWLKEECMTMGIENLKRYRILTLWRTIDSHGAVQAQKANHLLCSQMWLKASGAYLAVFLVHIAYVRSFSGTLWHIVQDHSLGVSGWQGFLSSPRLLGGLGFFLTAGLVLLLVRRFSRTS